MQQPTRRRGQGRPQGPEVAVGREKLIAATRDLLKTKAPAKITRLEIAEFAGVDPALIRYYFGDKSNLLTATVRQISVELVERLDTLLREKQPMKDALRTRIKVFLKVLADNPYYAQLVIEQILYGQREVARISRQSEIVDFFVELKTLLEAGRRDGEFRHVEPRFVHITMIGACEFFVTARPLVELLFGKREMTPALLDAYGDFLADLLLNGLSAQTPASR